jgi:hypothetical protein
MSIMTDNGCCRKKERKKEIKKKNELRFVWLKIEETIKKTRKEEEERTRRFQNNA